MKGVAWWASAGACGGEGEGRPGVDDRASEFQTESGSANADASTDDPNCQKDNDKIQTEDPNPKDSLPHQTKEFNLRQRKKQLKHFFCFLFILAILRWRVFALVLGHASMDYLLHHSPYPKRIKLVRNFVSRVGLLLQLVRTGSIRESLKIFRVEIADLQRAIQSKSYLDPQALNFIQVLSKFIREYSRHAGIPLFEPIYNPLMALSVLVLCLWITLPTKKWKLPIMLIYSIFISLFLYYQFYWHFKGRFKQVDRRGRGRRRSAISLQQQKMEVNGKKKTKGIGRFV